MCAIKGNIYSRFLSNSEATIETIIHTVAVHMNINHLETGN